MQESPSRFFFLARPFSQAGRWWSPIRKSTVPVTRRTIRSVLRPPVLYDPPGRLLPDDARDDGRDCCRAEFLERRQAGSDCMNVTLSSPIGMTPPIVDACRVPQLALQCWTKVVFHMLDSRI